MNGTGAHLRFAGVVPAAGASRRMGRPKATLRLDGRTFLERVVTALARGGCTPVWVVVAKDDEAVLEEARGLSRRDLPARILVNPDPGEGPITSLRLALDAVDRGTDDAGSPTADSTAGDSPTEHSPAVDGIAWLPLDHALASPELVARLVEEAERSGAALTLPTYEGKRGHPALFRRSLFAELTDPRLEGGARTVVHAHLEDACLVPVSDPGAVEDIDTPEEYDRVHRALTSEKDR